MNTTIHSEILTKFILIGNENNTGMQNYKKERREHTETNNIVLAKFAYISKHHNYIRPLH